MNKESIESLKERLEELGVSRRNIIISMILNGYPTNEIKRIMFTNTEQINIITNNLKKQNKL